MKSIIVCLIAATVLGTATGRHSGGDASLIDAARVMGPQECAECHEEEFEVWTETHHEVAGKVLTRDDTAREIAQALGIRRIKSDARCTSCHYTVRSADGREKAVAGVSCESCHGPARDWIDVHDDFGGPDDTLATETAAHRIERLVGCDEAGMHRPDRLQALATQCFRCHFVVDEELIAAGHPTGDGFELVSWSQGEVRHNFVRGGEAGNVEVSVERKRLMYVLGRLLELEHGVRALAAVDAQAIPASARRGRVEAAVANLTAIKEVVSIPEVDEVLAEVETATSPEELVRSIAERARQLEERHDGAELGALDGLIPPNKGNPVR